jgi:hypothetical protein
MRRLRAVAVSLLLGAEGLALGQAVSMRPAQPRPNSLNGNSSIAVSVSPSGVSFNLVAGGVAAASGAIAITSTVSNPLSTTVNLYGSFGSATAALSGSASGLGVPSACILGQVPTGAATSFTSFTQSNTLGAAGAGLTLVSISGLTANQSRTDNLYLKIDLSSRPQLPADTYVGVLFLQAQIF